MSNKKINQLKSTQTNTINPSNNLNIIRKQLRNKLIEAGLNCNEPIPSNLSKKSSQKRQNQQQKNYLPIISSLKNSLQIKNDKSKNQMNRNLYDIFSHRDMFIVRQAFIGSKLCRARQRDFSLENFQENFRRRLLENIKLQKIEQKLPSLRRIQRKQKCRTQENTNIAISSIKQIEVSKQIIHSSPRIKVTQKRSKTQQKPKINEQRVQQIKINVINQLPQFKTLTPWGQYNQLAYWKHQI